MSASAPGLAQRLVSRNPFDKAPRTMWPILLEIGLAIGLVAFILWWFRPRQRESDEQGAASGTDEIDRPRKR
jgi:hypothetical protein